MGAWGCSIFGDDLAADVKDDYKELMSFLEDDAKVKETLLQRHQESLSMDDERVVFWYAFALCQWKDGRLEADVKEKAIYYIDHPEEDGNLQIWKRAAEEAQDAREKRVCLKFYEKRREVLQKLKEQLNSPMPALKKRKIRVGKPALYKVGDVVRVEVPKNQFAEFRKLHSGYFEELMKKVEPLFDDNHFYMIRTSEETDPIDRLFDGKTEERYNRVTEHFAIFDWIGKEELSEEEIRKLPVIAKPPTRPTGEINPDWNCSINRFIFCCYELFYRDVGGRDEKYLKIGQFRKVFNDMSLWKSVEERGIQGGNFFRSALGIRYFESEIGVRFFEAALWHFATAGNRLSSLPPLW